MERLGPPPSWGSLAVLHPPGKHLFVSGEVSSATFYLKTPPRYVMVSFLLVLYGLWTEKQQVENKDEGNPICRGQNTNGEREEKMERLRLKCS